MVKCCKLAGEFTQAGLALINDASVERQHLLQTSGKMRHLLTRGRRAKKLGNNAATLALKLRHDIPLLFIRGDEHGARKREETLDLLLYPGPIN